MFGDHRVRALVHVPPNQPPLAHFGQSVVQLLGGHLPQLSQPQTKVLEVFRVEARMIFEEGLGDDLLVRQRSVEKPDGLLQRRGNVQVGREEEGQWSP